MFWLLLSTTISLWFPLGLPNFMTSFSTVVILLLTPQVSLPQQPLNDGSSAKDEASVSRRVPAGLLTGRAQRLWADVCNGHVLSRCRPLAALLPVLQSLHPETRMGEIDINDPSTAEYTQTSILGPSARSKTVLTGTNCKENFSRNVLIITCW